MAETDEPNTAALTRFAGGGAWVDPEAFLTWVWPLLREQAEPHSTLLEWEFERT